MFKSFITLAVISGVLLVGSSYGEWISGGRGWKYSNADTNFYPWSTACRIGIGTTDPGTARLAVMGGNLGIGTTSPASDAAWASPGLDISGTRGTAILRTTSASGIATLRMVGPGADGVDDWHINMGAGTNSTLNFSPKAGGGAIGLVLKNDGNVGIGTTNPGAKLDVRGNTLLNGVGIWSRSGSGLCTDTFYYDFTWSACIPLKIWAGCSHWTSNYVALLETTITGDSYQGLSQWDQLNVSTANCGAWTISRPSNGTLRITKTAGSYAGSTNWYIIIMGPTAFINQN